MTQAIVNDLNILQNSVITADANVTGNVADANIVDNELIDFSSILDKTVENIKEQTLGDIKTLNLNWDMSEQMEAFKEFLLQTTQEVNMEKSLDLTLARDITEIINQLKSAVKSEIAVDETDNEETELSDDIYHNAEELLVNEAVARIDNKTSDGKTNTEEPVFEQVLTYVNSNVSMAADENQMSQNNENPNPQNSGNQNNKVISNEICKTLFKPKETLETDIVKNPEDNAPDLDGEMLNELNIESLSSDADASGNNYSLNRQAPEELGLKVMLNRDAENFNTSFEKTISNVAKPVETSPEHIIEQITKHIESLKSTSKLNIVLNPQALGKVNLQILTTKDGLSAQFTVTTNEARDLLMKGLDGLKETLLAQGVTVDNISVKVSEPEESYSPDWTEQESEGRNKEQRQQKQEEKEKGLFEKTIAKSLNEDNGNV